jgi:(p)ppGpp synthase/HD superfamily hydrolase
MRLSQILEDAAKILKPLYGKERYKAYKDVLAFMPPKKVDHSLRVGATAAKSGLDTEAVEAAILHDYIERGGDLTKLSQLQVSDKAIRIIKLLSIDEKTPGLDDTQEVQHHIEQMLANTAIDDHDKNVAIIIKCADRIDNLKKRIKKQNLEPAYAAASRNLFNTLINAYTGDPELVQHVKRKIAKLTAALG